MKQVLGVLLFALILASCTKQEIYDMNVSNMLTINLVDKDLTRSVPTADMKSVENTINTLTVAVFKSDGSLKTLKEFQKPSNSVSFNVANLSVTDKVYCIANVPAGTFNSCKILSDFTTKEVTLDNSLTTNTVDIIPNNLLMSGDGAVVLLSGKFSSTVNLYHLNAKVSLASLNISTINGQTFVPKEIFLINVPSSFKYSFSNPYTSLQTYLHGALNVQIPNESQKLYLGSGNLNGAINSLYFYTSPNNTTTYTKLVISGMLGSKMTYYPIVIDQNVLPNKNYVLSVSIKGSGVDNPTDDLNYSNLTVNININAFEDVSKNVLLE